MQFGSGILGVEPPVDGGSRRIALGLIGVDGPFQRGSIGIAPLETGPGQRAELDLRIPSASSGQVSKAAAKRTTGVS